jgi:hypothetical protein
MLHPLVQVQVKKIESATMHAVSASLSPMVIKYARFWSSGNQRIKTSNMCDQQSVFSAKENVYAPQTAVRQYQPQNLGGNRINSVAPGTKSRPRWCPTGLTHTQKRRVQRLRVLEIRGEIVEKKSNKLFNRDKPIVPKVTWRKKCVANEVRRAADDIISNENSENNTDAPTDMDVDQAG